ncbi:MAG TPA: hypothetical protein VEH04_11355 [Verrucomicrobiae bacterium]|nr:hypothetical protein [Verrucomicrobiae bacterium]
MSLYDWLAGNVQTEHEATDSHARLQEALDDQANRRLQEGTISQDRYARDMAAASGKLESVGAGYRSGFVEGLAEGRDNVRNGIGAMISGILKFIPWQLWVVIVVGAFIYLGGIRFLQRWLARA